MKDFPKRRNRDKLCHIMDDEAAISIDSAHDRIDEMEPLLDELVGLLLKRMKEQEHELTHTIARIDACERVLCQSEGRALRDTESWQRLVDSLQSQLADALVRIDSCRKFAENADDSYKPLHGRVEALDRRIAALEIEPVGDSIHDDTAAIQALYDGLRKSTTVVGRAQPEAQPEPQYVWRYRDGCANNWLYSTVAPENHWNYVERCRSDSALWVIWQ